MALEGIFLMQEQCVGPKHILIAQTYEYDRGKSQCAGNKSVLSS